jgi:hypothetical protein
VGAGLPDASRGVARTPSKDVAALPTNDATARPVSRRSSTYVFMSFDMKSCFEVMFHGVVGHRVLHVRLASCRSCFMPILAMPSFDSPVVPDFIPDVFIPQLIPGLSILSP